MKGKLHPANDETINPSGNESINEIINEINESRRQFIKTGVSAGIMVALGGGIAGRALLGDIAEAAPIP
ncbi:MAG: hypothetical protein CTY34_04335, partial [Methylobacter sp.]